MRTSTLLVCLTALAINAWDAMCARAYERARTNPPGFPDPESYARNAGSWRVLLSAWRPS